MTQALYNQGVDPNPSSGVTDSITVELHDATNPFALAYSFTGLWQTNGTIACTFPGSAVGNMYYIVLRHRNTLLTWSANPITLGITNTYDFSDAANKAFGNNQASLGSSVYGIFTGDINQDQTVDAFDYIELDTDLTLGISGYYSTDLNGDGTVDAFDYIFLDLNLLNGLSTVAP